MIAGVTIDRDRLRRTTALHVLCERARSAPDSVAFRSKHLGIYRERTWCDYARHVAHYAHALKSIGLAHGDRAAIMGDVCEEWLLCDLAVQSLGAIAYGIYPTASPTEVEYQMRDGGAAIFIAEDQEYVDKILPIADRLPDLKTIVVIDDSAMFGYTHPKLHRLRDLLDGVDKPQLGWLEERIAALSPEDPAFIVYTSGTTGHPKGALVTHGTHLAATDTVIAQYPTLREKPHRTVAFLPMCHVLGRDVAITLPLISQLVPHFGEDPEDFATTLFEVAPTVMFTVPRYLQKFASHILVGILNSSRLKRAAYDFATNVARSHVRNRWEGKTALAPVCRPKSPRSGTCTASMSSRCTVRPKRPAALLPDSVVLSHDLAMSARQSKGSRSGWRRMAKFSCAVPTFSTAIGKTKRQPARSKMSMVGFARVTSVSGQTEACVSSTARAIFSSQPAARRSHHRLSKMRCARAPILPRPSSSVTVASISPPSSRSISRLSRIGRAPTTWSTRASPA